MGSIRVTQRILTQRALINIHSQQRTILDLQTQLATGLRVNAPSDDPIDARRGVNTRTSIGTNEQFLDNISSATMYLSESSTTLQTVHEILQRTRELTLQGANGTYSQEQLDNIAQEIDQLLEGLLDTANHQTANRYVFAGTRTRTRPFQETRNVDGTITAVTYEGNTEYINSAFTNNATVRVSEPGDRIFLSSADMFQTLIDIRDNLLSGNQDDLRGARLAELDLARQQLGTALARVGSVENRADRTSADVDDFVLAQRELLSDTLDADFADTIVQLNAQSNAFQAALSAAARVIQPSLLDFIA